MWGCYTRGPGNPLDSPPVTTKGKFPRVEAFHDNHIVPLSLMIVYPAFLQDPDASAEPVRKAWSPAYRIRKTRQSLQSVTSGSFTTL